jgi:predicted S18 family serine protease
MKSKNIIFAILISLFPLSSLIAAAAASPLDRNQIGRCCAPSILIQRNPDTNKEREKTIIWRQKIIVSKGFGQIVYPENYADDVKESAEEACRQALKMFSLPLSQTNILLLDSDKTPAKGGSAGLATFGAMVSALTGRPMNPQIAATGVVEKDGTIAPIGSLSEKWEGARAHGFTKLIVPEKNVECHTVGSEQVVNEVKYSNSGGKLVLFKNLNQDQFIKVVPVKNTREAVETFFGVAPEQLKLIPLSNKRTIRSRQLNAGIGDRTLQSLYPSDRVKIPEKLTDKLFSSWMPIALVSPQFQSRQP